LTQGFRRIVGTDGTPRREMLAGGIGVCTTSGAAGVSRDDIEA
jgi:hypothetical protein